MFPILLAYAFNGILLITFFIQRLQTFYSRHFFTFLTFFNYVIVSTFLRPCFHLRGPAMLMKQVLCLTASVCMSVCVCPCVCMSVCVSMYVTHKKLNNHWLEIMCNLVWICVMGNNRSDRILVTFDLDLWPLEKIAYNLKTTDYNSMKCSSLMYLSRFDKRNRMWTYSTLNSDIESLNWRQRLGYHALEYYIV